MASGHFVQRHVSVRLEPKELIRQPNHWSNLVFNRGAALPRLPQPHWIGRVAPQLYPPQEEIRPPDHNVGLHRYRRTFQTVGQPWQMMHWKRPAWVWEPEVITPPKVDLTIYRSRVVIVTASQPFWMWQKPQSELAQLEVPIQPDHTRLHRYRVGFQTVGQPLWMWAKAPQQLIDAELISNLSYPLFPYRQFAPAASSVGQPWWMWQQLGRELVPVEAPVARDHTQLHIYRVGYQTVGQPLALWNKAPLPVVDVELISRAAYPLFPYRQFAAVVPSVGQPFWMWMGRGLVEAPIEAIVQPDHTRLHNYRVGYQTVGQSVWMWDQRAREVVPTEVVLQPKHEALHTYRVGYQTVGQPAWMFKQTPVTLDYENIPGPRPSDLFAYRAITVVVVTPPNLHKMFIDLETGHLIWKLT